MSALSPPARLMLSPFRGYEELAKAEGPYVPRTSDYAHRGSSTTDRVLRTFGWLGLVGVFQLRARKRRQ